MKFVKITWLSPGYSRKQEHNQQSLEVSIFLYLEHLDKIAKIASFSCTKTGSITLKNDKKAMQNSEILKFGHNKDISQLNQNPFLNNHYPHWTENTKTP